MTSERPARAGALLGAATVALACGAPPASGPGPAGPDGARDTWRGPVAEIWIRLTTERGEGGTGLHRATRAGCAAAEHVGGTGAGGVAFDQYAGCLASRASATWFDEATALATTTPLRAVVPGAAPEGDGRVLFVAPDGSQARAASPDAEERLWAHALHEPTQLRISAAGAPVRLPGSDAFAPGVTLHVEASGRGHLDATATAEGEWWCHRSLPLEAGASAPARAPTPSGASRDVARALVRELTALAHGTSLTPGSRAWHGGASLALSGPDGGTAGVADGTAASQMLARWSALAPRLSTACLPPSAQ